jgi:seryl-tRNA synthetase
MARAAARQGVKFPEELGDNAVMTDTYSKSEIDSKFQAFRADVKADMLEIKTSIVSEIKAELNSVIKAQVEPLKEDFKTLKADMSDLKTDFNALRVTQEGMKTDIGWVKTLAIAIFLTLVGGFIKMIWFPSP